MQEDEERVVAQMNLDFIDDIYDYDDNVEPSNELMWGEGAEGDEKKELVGEELLGAVGGREIGWEKQEHLDAVGEKEIWWEEEEYDWEACEAAMGKEETEEEGEEEEYADAWWKRV